MAVLSEEQTMLRDMAREWTQNESPFGAFRKMRDSKVPTGYDPKVYATMAEMGWTGIVIPEAYGGTDFGWVSLGLVIEETAKTLTASPIASSAMVASAIRLGGDEKVQAEWLPRLASGEIAGALACDEGPRHAPDAIVTTAKRSGDKWVLDGRKAFVHDAPGAAILVVAAKTDDGIALFAVPSDAQGVALSARHLTDSRGHAELTLSGVSLDASAKLGDAKIYEVVLDQACALACAEMLGMADHAFQVTLAYLKQRVQFGEIIARFQALQHRMADLFSRIELMRSAVEGALAALDSGVDVPATVSVAKAIANEVMHLVSREVIQLHGGIGMTDEYDIAFYIKRARVLENAWGSAAFHRDRFATLAGY
jgi:alkylation response protein AidB-like acyl-CoA dehydrogenase